MQSIGDPLRTVTAWPRGGTFAIASPILVQTGYGERAGQQPRVPGLDQPLGTVVAGGMKHALAAAHLVKFRFNSEDAAITDPVPTITSGGNYRRPAGAAHAMGICTAFIEQANGGFNTTPAKGADEPMSTVTNTGSQQRLATASLATLRRNCTGRAIDEPVPTMPAGAEHHALVEYTLSPEHEAGAMRVAAFLISYYGTQNTSAADSPASTITTKDQLALVTVNVKGTPYVIVDICPRMLQPHELYRAQGFPADYIIDCGADGKPFTKTQQVHICSNSVSPPPMAALARANDPGRVAEREAAAA